MPTEISPHHNLSFVFLDPHKALSDELKTELVEELSTLIFLLWKAENESKITEDGSNER